VGTLRQLTCLRGALYERAAERAVRLGAQLPSLRLQSKGMCLCSDLFWGPTHREAGSTLLCLRKALRFTDGAVHVNPEDIGLFVEILDQAVHHFGEGNEEITAPFLTGLLALCTQHLRYLDAQAPVEALRGLHVALADLREKQAGALGASAEGEQVDLGADPSSLASARLAELQQLQVALAAGGVPA